MPSEYWAGRFMAMHDRFRNELLEPHRLAHICEAQAARGCLPANGSAQELETAAKRLNNPSTSAYAVTRLAQTRKHSSNTSSETSTAGLPSRIPQSATSGAILQTTPYNRATDLPSYSPYNLSFKLPSTVQHSNLSVSPIPEHAPAITTSNPSSSIAATTNNSSTHTHTQAPSNQAHTSPDPPDHERHPAATSPNNPLSTQATQNTLCDHLNNANNSTDENPTTMAIAADEDALARHVLARLDGLCTTPAARASLRAWRVRYARATQRPGLLPGAEGFAVPPMELSLSLALSTGCDGEAGRWSGACAGV
ncbi:30f8dda1-9c70-448c-a9ce-a48b8ad0b710 [Thermothielavioides terrestris]|uniref:30f8dda1-9c70-448c-a9ce-a48b8ad0b710 n=1 Tax=Thermothielavioides terrestris TaxID=2587410 RepID=A0A3S4CBV0_9PEZI|nr:30f8dda1-9c70-448c-a9ce-a48b8ad0b710 [Thermothielavioides terrestris]